MELPEKAFVAYVINHGHPATIAIDLDRNAAMKHALDGLFRAMRSECQGKPWAHLITGWAIVAQTDPGEALKLMEAQRAAPGFQDMPKAYVGLGPTQIHWTGLRLSESTKYIYEQYGGSPGSVVHEVDEDETVELEFPTLVTARIRNNEIESIRVSDNCGPFAADDPRVSTVAWKFNKERSAQTCFPTSPELHAKMVDIFNRSDFDPAWSIGE